MTEINITYIIRQNPWGKNNYDFDIIKKLNIIHCPWGHDIDEVNNFTKNKNKYKTKYAQKFVHKIQIGDIILVPQQNTYNLLLCKILSDNKTKQFNEIKVIYENNNIINICSDKYFIDLISKNNKYIFNKKIEPFTTIYRDIEIIKEINYQNNTELRQIFNRISCGVLL